VGGCVKSAAADFGCAVFLYLRKNLKIMIYDVAIIGGGPAGYTAAERAGAAGLSAVLFEKNSLGGVCLNEGCIPTKTLLYSAKVFDTARSASKYAVGAENVSFDLPKMIARKNRVVKKLVAGIRLKMTEHGVTTVCGEARITGRRADGNFTVSCGGEVYEAARLIVCAGSETLIPPIPGLSETEFWTSREALQATELPASLAVIGGGVVGMEFASFFNTLGTEVHVVEMLDEILPGMDRELSALLRAVYAKRGVRFHTGHRVTAVRGNAVCVEKAGEAFTIQADKVLLSAGRRAVTGGLGLETVGLEPSAGGLRTDAFMRTSVPGIYACGDITGFSMLAHTAVSEAETAVAHILGKVSAGMSYRAVPGVVYTNPEIAGAGFTEEQLQAAGTGYTVRKIPMAFSGRFVAENEMGNGVCKIILGDGGTILGAHLLGNPASELITIAGIAIEKGMKADELASFIFPHPTVGEILKEALR
jgi:dihydrolipoamide dehydrogenase